MYRLKTRWFSKWASKNSLSDSDLKAAIIDLIEDKGVSNLGGNLYKNGSPEIMKGKAEDTERS